MRAASSTSSEAVLRRSAVLALESDASLLARCRETGDEDALEELVQRHLPFARGLARRYSHTSEPPDDLVQVACVGLVAAIRRYDPSFGRPLRAFAAPTILGELRRHFRDTGWAVRVPRPVQERVRDVSQALDGLSTRLGRSPAISEIADSIGATSEEVLEALEARHAYRPRSIDAVLGDDEEEGEGRTRHQSVGAEDAGYAQAEQAAELGRAFASLSEREREIVRLRFEEDLSQSEIGERIGISQMHVSRLLRRALDRMGLVMSVG